MLFRSQETKTENPFALKEAETRKLSWKERFRRDLFRDNFTKFQSKKANLKKDIKDEQQKRAAAKVLSKLFNKQTIYLQDNEQNPTQHGQYSAFVPISKQVKVNDQITSTFPYIEYLTENEHDNAKYNVYNEITNCMRDAVDTNTVEIGWRSCLRKYLCDLDTLKAMDVYVELLKRGTKALDALHKAYANQCSQLVFFHRVCQCAKYFKQSSKINKNLQSSIEVSDKINQITLPKTSKYLFCSICLLYDCNQHNIDDIAGQFNFQYIAKKNIVDQSYHLNNMLQMIMFERNLTNNSPKIEKITQNQMNIEQQDGQIEEQLKSASFYCSQGCYMRLTTQTMAKKSANRRPIVSTVHRSLIHMAIDIFSYDPCVISLWIGKESKGPIKHVSGQHPQQGIPCENIFFYLMEQYDVKMRIRNQLYNTQVDYLMNESSRPKNEAKINIKLANKKKKNKPKFDHQNQQGYRVGCCFHYFIGQEPFDVNCENCSCKKRGFCLPQCQCPETCNIKKQGCSCKGKQDCRTKKCQCLQQGEECIPGLCTGCFDSDNIKNKKNNCRNSMIMRGETKYIRIGDSNVCGLGAFAGEDINKDDLVIVYTGEVTEFQIDYMREGLKLDDTFYNFSYSQGGSAIDARYIGNKARFINHSQDGAENLEASTMFSEGRFLTVLCAKKSIKKGEELFFDYDLTGEISRNFPGKYPFIKPKKKKTTSE